MTIHAELHSNILRLHFVEKWGVNTIARQLHIHHSVVERVLGQVGVPQAERTESRSIRDPYNDFIVETLNKFPDLTATRLYVMACTRGCSHDQVPYARFALEDCGMIGTLSHRGIFQTRSLPADVNGSELERAGDH